MMYYYRRKASPLKWIIIILILIAISSFAYWFYVNYFSKIDLPVINTNLVNEPQPVIVAPKILTATLTTIIQDVQADLGGAGYQTASSNTVLHQGDKIKTAKGAKAIFEIEGGTIIRLAGDSEIILSNLAEDSLQIEQLVGRSYHIYNQAKSYQVKSLQVNVMTSVGKFEVITNKDSQTLVVLDWADNVFVKIDDLQGELAALRLAPTEKALINLKAEKKDILKLEKFDPKILINKEEWYKWNSDLDKGNVISEPEEPDFSVATDSLQSSAAWQDKKVKLSWSVYKGDNFKNYQIIKSASDPNLQYPAVAAFKTSANLQLNTFNDDKVENGKKYYYRICVEKDNQKIICGNIASIEIPQEVDKVPPESPNLVIAISSNGVSLTWNKNSEADFKEYKVLRSVANILPQYPNETITTLNNIYYLDKAVNAESSGTYYYRICTVDLAANYACSNVQVVENGQLK